MKVLENLALKVARTKFRLRKVGWLVKLRAIPIFLIYFKPNFSLEDIKELVTIYLEF
jgi:hypothetical protein